MLRRGVSAGYKAAAWQAQGVALPRPVGAAAWVMGRRGFADAKDEGENKEQGKKEQPPKAGPGFWATFKKSFNDGFNKRAAEDEQLQKAQETVDKAKDDASAAAARAMEVPHRR